MPFRTSSIGSLPEWICIVQLHFPGLEPGFVFVSVNLRAGASHFEECRGNGSGQMPGSINLTVDHQVRCAVLECFKRYSLIDDDRAVNEYAVRPPKS